jgi:hypothetical protein
MLRQGINRRHDCFSFNEGETMETIDLVTEQAKPVLRDLQRNGMTAKVAAPGDTAYERAREIWNGAVEAAQPQKT